MNLIRYWRRIDSTLLMAVLGLGVICLLIIASATHANMDGQPGQYDFVMKQGIFFVGGLIIAGGSLYFDYRKLYRFVPILYGINAILLLVVKFAGTSALGAQRWIQLGPFTLQPSEFAKFAVVLLMGSAFCKNSKIWDSSKMIYFVPVLIMVALIYKQPNLSMVILLLSTCLVCWLNAGGPIKLFAVGGVCGAIGLAATITTALKSSILSFIIKPYQLERITTWLNPEQYALTSGYQIIQSLIAFASGGFWGVGFGNSKQKLYWIPEAHTDFIFAVIGEELGWIGCILVIGLFWTLIHRGLIIASRCPDMYGKILAVGITFSIGFQAFLNISVATSFLPATGVPLPFISYGGSSLMVSLWMIGVLLNISKKRIKKIRTNSNVRFL